MNLIGFFLVSIAWRTGFLKSQMGCRMASILIGIVHCVTSKFGNKTGRRCSRNAEEEDGLQLSSWLMPGPLAIGKEEI